MSSDFEDEMDLGQSWLESLSQFGFVKAAMEDHSEPFGDVWVKFRSSELDLTFVRDKGCVSALVGPTAVSDLGISQLEDLTHVLGALGEVGPGDVLTLDELGSKFRKNYAKVLDVFTGAPRSGWSAAVKRFQRAILAKTAPHLLAALELHDSQYRR
jgi:hypothetical protein